MKPADVPAQALAGATTDPARDKLRASYARTAMHAGLIAASLGGVWPSAPDDMDALADSAWRIADAMLRRAPA